MSAIKRFHAPLIVIFGVMVAMVAFASPSSAAPYTTQPTTSVSNQNPVAGGTVTFSGSGFLAGETITITLDNGTTFPSVVADASGAFSTTLTLSASLSGTHTLTATGATSGRTSSTTIQVAAASANAGVVPSSGGLAFTGAAVVGIGALGALLLVGGAAMVLATRRRKVNA
ncbi:MAG: hypothetical protein ABI903_13315 [Actinomycetota bacterium]